MSSKYDVVKLKVHLDGGHFYILSRFQLSKMLMFCKVPEQPAVRIALDTKRHFVNAGAIDVSQHELISGLVTIMRAAGFGEDYERLLHVTTEFYALRVPLVILIAGDRCVGKTTLAKLLSARLSGSTVINTEVLMDIVEAVSEQGMPVSARTVDKEDGIQCWEEECRRINQAVTAEVEKAVKEGKVLLVEGRLINLCNYVHYLDTAHYDATNSIVLGVHVIADPVGCATEWIPHDQRDLRESNAVHPSQSSGSAPSRDRNSNGDARSNDSCQTLMHHQADELKRIVENSESHVPFAVLRDDDAGSPAPSGTAQPFHPSELSLLEAHVSCLDGLGRLADHLHAIVVQRIEAELQHRRDRS